MWRSSSRRSAAPPGNRRGQLARTPQPTSPRRNWQQQPTESRGDRACHHGLRALDFAHSLPLVFGGALDVEYVVKKLDRGFAPPRDNGRGEQVPQEACSLAHEEHAHRVEVAMVTDGKREREGNGLFEP